MAASPHHGQRRQRRTSAFAYVCDRSVGLGARRFCDELHAEEARAMVPVTRNFIYRPGMKAWTMEIDPVDDRYLLVGSANSNIMLFDLHALGDDGASAVAGNAGTTTAYDTSNQLAPICCVRARSIVNRVPSSASSSTHSLQYGISAVDWYPVDAGIFVSSSLDGHVKVWDSDRFDLVSEFALQSKVFCAKFSRVASQHSLIAAVTEKGEVRLCDMTIESSIHSLLGHQDEVWSLAWSPENEYQLSTGSRNGEIRMWDIRRSGSTACLLCLNHEGKAVVPGRSSVHTNIKRLPAMSLNAASKPVSRKRRRLDGNMLAGPSASNSAASENRMERERRRLTSVSATVKRNDPHAAASVSFAAAHRGGVNSLAYTPDGRFLLSSGNDQKLRLWDSKTGEHAFMNYQEIQNQVTSRNVQMAVIQEADPWDSTLVFHPNGRLGELNVYQVFGDHGMPLMRCTAHYQQITACVYRKSMRELYTGGEDGIIMKWRPTPADLCPEAPEGGNPSQSAGAQLAGVRATHVVGAADGDVDAWSDEEEELEDEQANQGDIFIPPILRQYEDADLSRAEIKHITTSDQGAPFGRHLHVGDGGTEELSFDTNVGDRERVLSFKSKRIEELNIKLKECEVINASLLQTINGGAKGVEHVGSRAATTALLHSGKPLFHALETCKEQEFRRLYDDKRAHCEQLAQQIQSNEALVQEMRVYQSEKEEVEEQIKQLQAKIRAITTQKDDEVDFLERKLVFEHDRLRREKDSDIRACQEEMEKQMGMQLDVTTQRTIEENERVQLELRYQSSQLERLVKQVDQLLVENKQIQQEKRIFEDMNASLSKRVKFYEQLFAKMQQREQLKSKHGQESLQTTKVDPIDSNSSRRFHSPRKPPLPSLEQQSLQLSPTGRQSAFH